MVEEQLRRRGIDDPRVLSAMQSVPREAFVSRGLQESAYDDGPLSIGHGQTISQPFVVAFMAQCLQLTGSQRVLEIGTGSGYGAAVLSPLAAVVHSVERIPLLANRAQVALSEAGYGNVHVHLGDGTLGLSEYAPFDAICVTAGAECLPPAYKQQLAAGGRIVIPLGCQPRSQTMHRFTRRGERWLDEELGGFAFVPLVGAHGWQDTAP